jgi:CRP/FNR family transcriptional regulator, cyclic AMP receptor protein
MDRAELLGTTPFFAGAPVRALQQLADAATSRDHRKGDHVCRQGDTGTSIMVVAAGSLKLVAGSADGDEVLLATVRRGDAFGELAALDGGRRTATAIALETSTVMSVPVAELRQAMAAHPSLLDSVVTSLAALARRATEQRCDLVFHDLPGRVAKALLELYPDGKPFTALHQGEIATLTAGTRQSVNQVLKAFEVSGWISIQGRAIRIVDRAQLARRVGAAAGPGWRTASP